MLYITSNNNIYFMCGSCRIFRNSLVYWYEYALLLVWSLFGSVIFCEGSICFVLFFVIVYFLKKKKKELCVFFSFILEFLIRRAYYMRGAIEYLVLFNKFQWMMVFVLPLILMYNGKEGRKYKWFYYLFYPMHIWILYAIANL